VQERLRVENRVISPQPSDHGQPYCEEDDSVQSAARSAAEAVVQRLDRHRAAASARISSAGSLEILQNAA
jgi:hypothetical protein